MRFARAAAIAVVLVASTAGPGRAASLVDSLAPPPGSVVLGRFATGPETYVGLHLRVVEEAVFTTLEVGAHSGDEVFRFIGLDARTGGGHGSGSGTAAVGALGTGVSVPGPSAGRGGTTLRPGDYYAVGAAPGGAATFEVRGPSSTRVVGHVEGPARSFTDVDFSAAQGVVVAAPVVDHRSVHGRVTVTARHALFASFVPCPGAQTAVSGPEPPSGWWGPRAVSYGAPGAWTFSLDYETSAVQTESPSWPCINSLVTMDVALPGPIPAG